MKKRFAFLSLLTLVLCVLLLPAASGAAKLSGEIKVYIENTQLKFDVEPQLINGKVLVPFRDIFEPLGVEVTWNAEKNAIIAAKQETVLEIFPNKTTARKNGKTVTLDSVPIIYKNRVLIPLRFVAESFGIKVNWDVKTRTVIISSPDLPVVGTPEKLKELLSQAADSGQLSQRAAITGTAPQLMEEKAAGTADSTASETANDFSSTNIQVQGVDEADVVKTDGKYIYQVNNLQVIIFDAYPADNLKIVNELKFNEENFRPQEIFVDDSYLVVIGSSWENRPWESSPDISEKKAVLPSCQVRNTVKAIIYDIKDKSDIKEIREVEIEGNYVSSRKIGTKLYLIANRYMNYYHIMEDDDPVLPSYRDSAVMSSFQSVSCQDIRYFPDCIQPNYLLVAGLDIDRPKEKMDLSTFLGAGENIYSTQENLYIAVTNYRYGQVKPFTDSVEILPEEPPRTQTSVYRFSLNQGKAEYCAKGSVPGTILNQFSMDENNGFFRIATTTGEVWRSDEFTSKNNIYVLNKKMNVSGKIEDIAPGERIYSVRFMGDRAYMVTFKKVDPLFVIDLKDPREPKILGKLKIPGYSDYLHPYDENHIIGFGKDTIELSQEDWTGKDSGTMAFYQGMKIALFDVTDVEHPVQKFQEIIGDRGTDSELLYNHKALLFSKEKNLLAFPVTLMEINNKDLVENGFPQYGEFSFQGAYIYHLDLENGFRLKGRITHLENQDLLKSGYNWYGSDKNVERILYIENTLYTLSKAAIKANALDNLKEISSLDINQ